MCSSVNVGYSVIKWNEDMKATMEAKGTDTVNILEDCLQGNNINKAC